MVHGRRSANAWNLSSLFSFAFQEFPPFVDDTVNDRLSKIVLLPVTKQMTLACIVKLRSVERYQAATVCHFLSDRQSLSPFSRCQLLTVGWREAGWGGGEG